MKVKNFLDRAVSLLSTISVGLSIVAVGLIMGVTVIDVFMRYFFTRPITGSTELVEFMMVVLVLSVVPAALRHRHISVDVLMEKLTPKGRSLFDAITIFIGSWLVVIMGWRAFAAALFMIRNDIRSPTLDIPVYPFYIIVSVAFIFLFISMIALVVQKTVEVLKT